MTDPGAAPARQEAPAEWPYRLTHPVEIRFRDTDAMGHVNNAVFVTYLEVARQAYWQAMSGQRDYEKVPFIFAHVTVDFRSPAHCGETLEVGLRVEWIGRKSFAFTYRIRERERRRLVAEATSVQAIYDYEKRRTYPFPEELRRAMEAFEGRRIPARP